MSAIVKYFKPASVLMFVTLACLLLAGGCARYSRNVNTLYEPSATVSGGSGDVYIVIPENQQTRSPDIKWVLGAVKDDDNKNIDEVFSPRSPAEIIQSAFGLEFKKAGYTIIPTTRRPDLKAKCRVLVGVDLFKDGRQIKRFQYEATSSRTDIKDRDLLAETVLKDALQSVMLKAMPELHALLK